MIKPIHPGWIGLANQFLGLANLYAAMFRTSVVFIAVIMAIFGCEVWLKGEAESVRESTTSVTEEIQGIRDGIAYDSNQISSLEGAELLIIEAEKQTVGYTGDRPQVVLPMYSDPYEPVVELPNYAQAMVEDILTRRSRAAERIATNRAVLREREAFLAELKGRDKRIELLLGEIEKGRGALNVILYTAIVGALVSVGFWLARVQWPYDVMIKKAAKRGLAYPEEEEQKKTGASTNAAGTEDVPVVVEK